MKVIKLYGRLAKKFGKEHRYDVRSPLEAVHALCCTLPGFREEMRKGKYQIKKGDRPIDLEEAKMGSGDKELHLIPSSSLAGATELLILGAIIITTVVLTFALMPTIQAPDPNDLENEDNNTGVYDGPVNVVEQGHPVPIVYGRMMVGSVVGSSGLSVSEYNPGSGGVGGGGGWDPGEYSNETVEIRGGGKSGGSARSAQEAPDTLISNTVARVLDVVSEGEIGGLVNGLESVYFDRVPVMNSDGTYNWSGVNVEERVGLPDQQYAPGFTDAETPVSVGVTVTNSDPVERSVGDVDAVKVILGTQQFFKQNPENGDVEPTEVRVRISLSVDGGGFTTIFDDVWTGKQNSAYQRSYRVDIPFGTSSRVIRVERVTPDRDSLQYQDEISWDLYTEVTEAKLQYPDSAYYAVTVDAKQFGSRIPVRSYLIDGIKVEVPSNYDPSTRSYTGVWDGTFKRASTDNGAWQFRDLVVNDRYGLGKYLDDSNINKYTLYEIARYNDAHNARPDNGDDDYSDTGKHGVPDGEGGFGPRFTSNIVINSQDKALELLTELAASFRTSVAWHSGGIHLYQDSPASVSRIVNRSNCIEGKYFSYESDSMGDEFSAVLITWNNPDDFYRTDVAVVENPELVKQIGWEPKKVTLKNCIREIEAIRHGEWLLEEQSHRNEAITFGVGFDFADILPGDVVETHDDKYTTSRRGGRIKSGTTSQLVLDKSFNFESGDNYFISVTLPDGTVEKLGVTNPESETDTVPLSTNLSQAPNPGAVWNLSTDSVVNRSWRVIDRIEEDDGEFTIRGMLYDENSYARVENNAVIESTPFSDLPSGPLGVPSNLAVKEFLKTEGNAVIPGVTVTWTSPDDARVIGYQVQHKPSDNAPWEFLEESAQLSRTVLGVAPGVHQFRVRSIGALDTRSRWIGGSVTLDGEGQTPAQTPGDAAWNVSAGNGNGPSLLVSGAKDTDFILSAIRIEYRATEDENGQSISYADDAGWTRWGDFDPGTTLVEISGLQAQRPYQVSISYVSVFGVPGGRLVEGPVTTGALVADEARSANTISGKTREAIERLEKEAILAATKAAEAAIAEAVARYNGIRNARTEARNLFEFERTERIDGDLAEATTRETQISAVGDSVALVETEVTTLATALTAETTTRTTQFSAVNNSIAVVESEVQTVASDLSAETSARQTQVSAVEDNVATLTTQYNTLATDQSSTATALTNLTATVNDQGDDLTALSSDFAVVQADVDTLFAARIQRVQAGAAFAGVKFVAEQTNGQEASEIRYAAQKFGYGLTFNAPRRWFDAIANEEYALNAAGTVRTFEVDWDTGRGWFRANDGTVLFDSFGGGVTEDGLPPSVSTQSAETTTLVGGGSIGSTWTTMAELQLNSLPEGGMYVAEGVLRFSDRVDVQSGAPQIATVDVRIRILGINDVIMEDRLTESLSGYQDGPDMIWRRSAGASPLGATSVRSDVATSRTARVEARMVTGSGLQAGSVRFSFRRQR